MAKPTVPRRGLLTTRAGVRAGVLLAVLVPLGCAGPTYRREVDVHGHRYALDVPVRYAIVDRDGQEPVRMAYIEQRPLGDAPVTLVLVHGMTTGRELWRPLMAVLPARWRTVAPDLVGYGLSSKPDFRYAPDMHARHVAALVGVAVRRGPVVLVGHGYGAKVVLLACTSDPKLPARCRALVLVNPDPLLSPTDPWADVPPYEKACADFWANCMLGAGLNQLIEIDASRARALLEQSFHDRASITREMVDAAVAGVRRGGALRARYRTARHAAFYDVAAFQKAVGTMDRPVLILHGQDDRLVSPTAAVRYQRVLRRPVLVEFGRAGHDLVREHPQPVAGAIGRFLKPVATRRPTTRPTRTQPTSP